MKSLTLKQQTQYSVTLNRHSSSGSCHKSRWCLLPSLLKKSLHSACILCIIFISIVCDPSNLTGSLNVIHLFSQSSQDHIKYLAHGRDNYLLVWKEKSQLRRCQSKLPSTCMHEKTAEHGVLCMLCSTYDSKEDYSMHLDELLILSFSLFVFISLSSKTSVKRAHREIQYNCVIYQSYLLIIMSLPEKSVGSTSNGGLPRGDKTTHLV